MFDAQDNSDKIIYIPINAIKPNPYQPRKFFDVTSVSDLAQSIKKIGLLEPITVRRLRVGVYELVSGERRLKAMEIAGIQKIKAVVVDITDNQSALIALTSNMQRKQLSFFEQAFAYYHLIFDHGISKEKIAHELGVRESEISGKLSLCKLSSTVRNIITENKLTEEHALALLSESSEEKQLTYLKTSIEKGFTGNELMNFISKENRKEIHKKNKVRINDYSIVFNTIKKAVKLIKENGVDTKTKRTEHKKYYEYVIKIAK